MGGILARMDGNPHFPSPKPSLAAVASAVAALDEAQTASLSRTRGTAQLRDEQKTALLPLVGELRAYVQSVADGNPDSAAAIIESAGMSVKRPAVQSKAPFAVKQGGRAGSVALAVRSAGDRAIYGWQWSTDGGVTWLDAPQTLQAKTEIAGLPLGKTCWFRVRVVTTDGPQNCSEPLSILVR
jgi:hypothetical protein